MTEPTPNPRWTVTEWNHLAWDGIDEDDSQWFYEVPDEAHTALVAAIRDAAEVPALRARLEAAGAVIRRLRDGYRGDYFDQPLPPAEAEAIARTRGDQPPGPFASEDETDAYKAAELRRTHGVPDTGAEP